MKLPLHIFDSYESSVLGKSRRQYNIPCRNPRLNHEAMERHVLSKLDILESAILHRFKPIFPHLVCHGDYSSPFSRSGEIYIWNRNTSIFHRIKYGMLRRLSKAGGGYHWICSPWCDEREFNFAESMMIESFLKSLEAEHNLEIISTRGRQCPNHPNSLRLLNFDIEIADHTPFLT